MFNTIAHSSTLFYYVHVLRNIAALAPTSPSTSSDPVVINFLDFRPKFFTIWGLVTQTLLFLLCVAHDVSRVLPVTNPVRRGTRSLRDLILVAVSGPAAVTVTAMFWGLFLLDRELVMPAVLDEVVPVWMNHAMHSFVLVLVIVQVLAEPHHPPHLGIALAMGTALSGAYIYTLFDEYAKTGRWIYPIFGVLSWPGRLVFSALTVLLFLSQVVVVRAAVKARWGSAKDSTKAMRKRKD